MVAYEFYWLDEVNGCELLGILPERRKNPERITEKSVLGWADKFFSHKFTAKNIYFIPVIFDRNAGMSSWPSPASAENIEELLGELQKNSASMDEFAERASETLQAAEVRCISCGRGRPVHEMQKVFYEKHKGICKICFGSEIEE